MRSCEIAFFEGACAADRSASIDQIIDTVARKRCNLHRLSVEKTIAIVDAFATKLLERRNPLHRLFPGSGIPYLASWCRRGHLETAISSSFPLAQCLDQFVAMPSCPDKSCRAFPKGIAVHWMAGNVPTLGFISLLMGLLTKNGNIVKLASGSDNLLPKLLEQLSTITTPVGRGAELLDAVAVIRYEHATVEVSSALSQCADVRIMWGSDESVASLRTLPTKPDTTDIVFPSRTSFIVVGQNSLAPQALESLTKKIARDISVFEQKACASPHTIFLLTKDDDQRRSFALALRGALEASLTSLPKATPSQQEVMAILNLRAHYDMFHEAWYSKGTQYTVLSDDELQLGPAVGNRTVFVRRLDSVDSLPEILPPNIQTVGLAVDSEDFDRITNLLGLHGIHRFTQVGSMTHFDLPWDGHFIPNRLTRWASRPSALSRVDPVTSG